MIPSIRLSIRTTRANQQFVKWTLYITLGNDVFYSYGSYRESTAELQGPLNLTVSSYRTLSSEIHFADHRSKPGIYGGCLGEVHLYNSFTVICDFWVSNTDITCQTYLVEQANWSSRMPRVSLCNFSRQVSAFQLLSDHFDDRLSL